jgi:chorismate synthase
MSGLRWNTAGESHGRSLIGVLEGLPSGLALDVAPIDALLERRQRGHGRSARQQLEQDRVEVLAGLRHGRTLGSPLALAISNRDATIDTLPVPADPRPGHADLAGCQKHGVRDPRLVLERASARETAIRTALGGAAAQLLAHFGIEVFAHVVELGGERAGAGPGGTSLASTLTRAEREARRAASAVACVDAVAQPRIVARIDAAREELDSLGGVFEVLAFGLPPGLGGYADPRERLTSRLGAALFSIPAIKGVEIGLGFESARTSGARFHDPIVARPAHPAGAAHPFGSYARASNRAGGLEGGMTNGEVLVLRAAMKPIPTLRQGVATVEFESKREVRATYQRSDVTSVPAASVVGEALVALVLADALLAKLGGDSLAQVERAWQAWLAELRAL